MMFLLYGIVDESRRLPVRKFHLGELYGEIGENGKYLHARQKRVPQGHCLRAAMAVPENLDD